MRYLFVTLDGGGNLSPELALAVRLSERGHDVAFLGHGSQRAAVQAAGLGFSVYSRAPDHDTSSPQTSPIDDWAQDHVSKVAALIRDTAAFGPAALFAADLLAELDARPVDALAIDYWLFGALVAAESRRVPTAVLRHTRYSQMGWWNEGLQQLNAVRAGLELGPLPNVFEQYRRVERELVMTSPLFDPAAEQELPANVRHIGPQVAMPATPVGSTDADGPPLVVASFSTTYQAQEDVMARVVAALGTLPVRWLVTTGPAVALSGAAPDNVEVREWAPHGEVLPSASLVVTHAGHGTVMTALAHGVPLLCLPMGRDQDGNAARVEALGAGAVMPAGASPDETAAAIRAVLDDAALNTRARDLGAALRREIAADRGALELEALAAAG